MRSNHLAEFLERRLFLSNSIPLNPNTWTALGPAPLGSTYSGRAVGIAAHPSDANTIYLATAGGGVWKTTNGGTNWTPLTDAQATLFMGAIAIAPSNPNIIYAGTGESNNSRLSFYGRGVLKSTDAGATWTLMGSSVFDRHTISSVQVDPTNSNVVFVAVAGAGQNGVGGGTGIYKSIDGGGTWTNTTASISTTDFYSDVQIDPTNSQNVYMAIGTLTGVSVCGVYKSTNGGASWSLAGNFPGGVTIGNTKIAISRSSPGTVYASVIGTGQAGSSTYGSGFRVFKTIDAGATWAPTTATPPNWTGTQGWYDTAISVSPSDPNVVFLTGSAGTNSMLRSINGGASWSDFHTGGNTPHVDHHAAAFDASGRLLDANDGGLWRLPTPATSTSWVNLNGNLNTIQFLGIAQHPANINIAFGGSQDNGTERFNDGLNWTQVEGGDGGDVNISPNNNNRVYHIAPVASFGSSSWFRRSDDGGTTWVSKVNGITSSASAAFYAPFVIDPNSFAGSDRLLLGTNQVYESTNNADSWTALSTPGLNGWTTSVAMSALAVAKTNANTIYAAAGNSLYVTLNHGATWTNRSISGSGNISDLAVSRFDPQIAYATHDEFGGGHVFRTIDGGAQWTDISSNLPNLPTYTIEINPVYQTPDHAVLYVGTDNGLYVTTNGGASWSPMAAGLPHVQVRDVEYDPAVGILAAGTHGRGLWELSVPVPVGIWTGLGDNASWVDANNWSANTIPGPANDVLISVLSNPLITATDPVSVRSVTSDEALSIANFFTVTRASTFANVSVGGAGNLVFGDSAMVDGTLALASGARVTLNAAGDKLLKTKVLSLVGAARLDLNDNDLLLDYSGASQLIAIQQLINAARAGGAWTGDGLTSSTAGNNPQHNTTLGAMEATDYSSIYGSGATFDGEALDDSMVLVKYTWYGDTDFNGRVNFDDYVRTDSGFNNHLTGWLNGDFDGNGSINFDDYVLIDLAFNTQGVPLGRRR
jgi:hypothetical protein